MDQPVERMHAAPGVVVEKELELQVGGVFRDGLLNQRALLGRDGRGGRCRWGEAETQGGVGHFQLSRFDFTGRQSHSS
jgi:hypothetical protein